MRATPFGYVFGEMADLTFPAIEAALDQSGAREADRDQFVLLEPVAHLLRDIVPEHAGPDILEAHVLLLHHAFRYWAAHKWIYRIGEPALARASAQSELTSQLPRPAFYLQLPELRVWGSPRPAEPPEPLDGMFVMEAMSGGIGVLAIFGLRPDRPGFSAVGLEGRADTDDPTASEIEVAAARDNGSAPFSPILAGGSAAGLYSVANAGELLLLVCRLLALLPRNETPDPPTPPDALEHVVQVD
jgi:hypothetical protein